MATRWTQAATILPPTIKVCGHRLLPFCLRHRVALEAIGSPILSLQGAFGAEDIIMAVRILSTHDIEEARRPISFIEGLHLQMMRMSVTRIKAEANKLLLYFAAQSLWPRFWERETKSPDSGIPWQLAVIASLVRNGHTTQEAWTMPEAEAIWLHIAHVRAAGDDISVISDREWDAMEAFKAKSSPRFPSNNSTN